MFIGKILVCGTNSRPNVQGVRCPACHKSHSCDAENGLFARKPLILRRSVVRRGSGNFTFGGNLLHLTTNTGCN